MRLLPHRTRLLAHKKLLGILTLLFALAGVLQPLEAHNASIEACRKLADSGWTCNEQAVWDYICESKDVDFKDADFTDYLKRLKRLKAAKKCKGSGSDNNNCLKASFLHDILFQKCYRDVIGPRGVHIKNAKFVTNEAPKDPKNPKNLGKVDLSWGKIPWPLRLELCSFQSLNMSSLVAEREIVLTNSEISDCLNLQSVSIQRDLILKGLKVKNGSTTAVLTAARIGGNLSMANARFRNLDLSFASVGARLDGNTFANISRQPATGSLIQNHIEHMLASPEMPASSGVTAKSDPRTAKGDLIMSGASITGKADLSGTQVNGRLHLWKDASNPAGSSESRENCVGGDTVHDGGSAGQHNPSHEDGEVKTYNLHGLTYDEIVIPQNNGKSNEKILEALKKWLGKDEGGSVQPYMYLASRLRAKNNFYISEQVLLAGQKFLAGKKWERIPDESSGKQTKESIYEFLSGGFYRLLDDSLFNFIIWVKQEIYQSPDIMFWILILMIILLVFYIIIIIARKNLQQRCIQAKTESKKQTPSDATTESNRKTPEKFWFQDKLNKSERLRRIEEMLRPLWPWIDWKEDIKNENRFIFIAIKILFILIFVRFILPVGIDILSIIF